MTIPTINARKKPAASVHKLAPRLARSLPLTRSFHHASAILETGGISVESITRPATSQITARDVMERMLMLRRFRDGIGELTLLQRATSPHPRPLPEGEGISWQCNRTREVSFNRQLLNRASDLEP